MGLLNSEMDHRWKRNVRNVLQRRKTVGDVTPTRYGTQVLKTRLDLRFSSTEKTFSLSVESA